jgi:hypothetical protein
MPICREKAPALMEHATAHTAACWLYQKKEG